MNRQMRLLYKIFTGLMSPVILYTIEIGWGPFPNLNAQNHLPGSWETRRVANHHISSTHMYSERLSGFEVSIYLTLVHKPVDIPAGVSVCRRQSDDQNVYLYKNHTQPRSSVSNVCSWRPTGLPTHFPTTIPTKHQSAQHPLKTPLRSAYHFTVIPSPSSKLTDRA